jgi:murein DD-endopeptidase MepM/ murein hydrolase activator NlpD
MSGYITQRHWNGHRAIDIGGSRGTPVMASDSGFVAVAQWSDVGYGRMIIIDHGNGTQTLYAHLSKYFVEVGQSVGKGEMIGHCGSTGNSTGPHLHFEIIQRGVRRNPFIFLP